MNRKVKEISITVLVKSPGTCENLGKVEPLSTKFLPEIEREKM
jgi:hypothetical protein